MSTIEKTLYSSEEPIQAIMEYFAFKHLPENLQEISLPFYNIAHTMNKKLPDGAEKSAGLRKLLEAKDCMVRGSGSSEICKVFSGVFIIYHHLSENH